MIIITIINTNTNNNNNSNNIYTHTYMNMQLYTHIMWFHLCSLEATCSFSMGMRIQEWAVRAVALRLSSRRGSRRAQRASLCTLNQQPRFEGYFRLWTEWLNRTPFDQCIGLDNLQEPPHIPWFSIVFCNLSFNPWIWTSTTIRRFRRLGRHPELRTPRLPNTGQEKQKHCIFDGRKRALHIWECSLGLLKMQYGNNFHKLAYSPM
jgi:hypothetical protein